MLLLSLSHSLLFVLLQATTPAQPPANVATTVQAPAPSLADSPTPTDPKELLELGRKVNGLTGPEVQPWHLKATFEIFDDDGKSKDKGTFEEWWVSDKQYKLTYQSADFSQTEYGTDHGILRTGNAKWPTGPLVLARREIVQPLPAEGEMSYANPEVAERSFSGVKLRCVDMRSRVPLPANAPPSVIPSYCFNIDKPILRSNSTFTQAIFNRILLFEGRYLGGDIEVTNHAKEYLKLHLDLAELLNQPNTQDFQPPADAVAPPPRRITVSGGVAAGNILTKVQPEYPAGAMANHIQGTVVMQATISEKGRISSLRVISGPQELQEAALNAVRQWSYKPYLLNGEPVEVQTLINVVFSLGGR